MKIAVLDLTGHPLPLLEGMPRVGEQIVTWLSQGLPEADYRCYDIEEGGEPVPSLEEFDGLLLSGSEHGVYDNRPWDAAVRATGRVSVFGDARVDAVDTSGGRASGVRVGEQVVSADQVVVATGPWAAELLAPLGFDVPIEPRRIDTMYMQLPKGARQLRTCVTDGTANIVIRPDMGATILAAAYPPEMELVADPNVVPTEQSEAEHLARIEAAPY